MSKSTDNLLRKREKTVSCRKSVEENDFKFVEINQMHDAVIYELCFSVQCTREERNANNDPLVELKPENCIQIIQWNWRIVTEIVHKFTI